METKNYYDELHKKRLYDETVKTIKLDDLLQYVISTINTKEITIYHFIIGAKMHHFISDPDDTMQNQYPRNHECPQFVKNLFFNPDLQFSPEFYYNLSNHETIIIRQVLFLIDPMYNTYPEIEGFFDVFKGKMPYLITKHTVEHNDFKKTYIVTKIDPIVIPERITEQQILNVLEVIESFGKFVPILVNIMDCSSSTVKELYVNNTSNRVYITQPNCLLIDTQTQYLPMITLDNISKRFASNGTNGIVSSQEEQTSSDIYNSNDILCIRWSNYNEDVGYLEDLKGISDICPYSNRTYEFLITNYKDIQCNNILVAICKVWSLTRVTKEYEFVRMNQGSFEQPPLNYTEPVRMNQGSFEQPPLNYTEPDMIKINFNTVSFQLFALYWNSYKTFRDMVLEVMDPYFKHNIKKFIDIVVKKYDGHSNQFMVRYNIVDILKIEAFEIFKLLDKYFPKDKITFATTEYSISLPDIAEYVKAYGICL